MNVTAEGKACKHWKDSSYKGDFYVKSFGLEENYCRNPSWHGNPWCYKVEGSLKKIKKNKNGFTRWKDLGETALEFRFATSS